MKNKLLFEDATMYYNRWVSGIASREFNAQRLKFKDLVNRGFDVSQSPNDAKADPVLPHEVANAANLLGNVYADTVNAIKAFENAQKNEIVKRDKIATQEIEEILIRLRNIIGELSKIPTTGTSKE